MDLGNELIGGGAVMGFQFHIHTSDLVFLQGHSLSENCVWNILCCVDDLSVSNK